MLKITTLASAILLIGAGTSFAADMAIKAAPIAPRPACAQFGGFHIGGHGGWGYQRHNHEDRNFLANNIDSDLPRSVQLSDDSWLAGVQAGYGWQSGCTVWGVEADWSWTGLSARGDFSDGDGPGAEDSSSVRSRMNWFGTLRARSGVVVDNLLLYVTGGFAYAHFDNTYTITENAPLTTVTYNNSAVRWGWTAGVGTEWRWNNNWSVKSEFLYLRFVEDDYTIAGATINGVNFGNPGSNYRINVQDDAWVTRIGLNYRW